MKYIKFLISELFSIFSEILNIAGFVTLFVFVLIGFIYNWNIQLLLVDLSKIPDKDLLSHSLKNDNEVYSKD